MSVMIAHSIHFNTSPLSDLPCTPYSSFTGVIFHIYIVLILALYFIIHVGDRPKMTQLCSFELKTGIPINVVSGIARDYRKVGQLLLEGSNDIDSLEMSNHYQTKDIADRILKDWLSGKGKLPVTWGTLIDVLQESGLSVLVYDIEGQLSDLHRDHDEL